MFVQSKIQIQSEKATADLVRAAPEAEGMGVRVAVLIAVVIGAVTMLGAVGVRIPIASVSPAVVAGD